MGTLADQLEVPVTKASRGLSPPSHFPARFRSLVDSICYSAARHAWRTSGRPEEFHLQPPSEPCVNLSIHTAPVSHSLETSQFQADEERN